MPNNAVTNVIALMLFISTFFSLLTATATSSGIKDSSSIATNAGDQEDLSSMLRRAPFHEARVFALARKHIQDIETSPACHQLATSTLIDSCQSFSSFPGQDSARITDHSLDQVRQEYAARLAVCELQGIKYGIPAECTQFVASYQACPRTPARGFFHRSTSAQEEPKRPCYPEFTPQQLTQCVDSLFDHGQRWTSYSNAQTNAIVICQASRGVLENEEHLHKLQEALQSQASVSETLSRAVQEAEERLTQHRDYTRALQQFQNDLTARNEAALAQADSVIARLLGKVDSTTEVLLGVLTKSFKVAGDETHILTNNIRTTNDHLNAANDRLKTTNRIIDQTRAAIQEFHDEAAIRGDELTSSQELALKGHQALVSDMRASLENVRDVTVLDLVGRLREFEAIMAHHVGFQQQAIEHAHNKVMQSLISQHEIIDEHNQKIAEMDFSSVRANITTYLGLLFFIVIVSRISLVLGAVAATGVCIHSLIGSFSIPLMPSLALPTFSPIASSTFRLLACFSAAAIVIMLAISGIAGFAILIRNFIITSKYFNDPLDIEIKRESSAYDV